MKKWVRHIKQEGFTTRYSRETERGFLFYATVGMLIVWVLTKLPLF